MYRPNLIIPHPPGPVIRRLIKEVDKEREGERDRWGDGGGEHGHNTWDGSEHRLSVVQRRNI